MVLEVVFCIDHQWFVVFAHIVRLLAVHPFQAAVLGPCQSQFHTPAGMKCGKQGLQRMAVENGTQKLEFTVGVAQPVTMGQVELLAMDFCGQRFAVQDDAAFLRQVVAAPDVMVARKEVYFHSEVRQFGQLAQKARVAFGHHQLEFVPEVKHVAQQIDGRSLVLDAVQKVHQPAFLRTAVLDGTRTQMGVGEEIYILHKAYLLGFYLNSSSRYL